jgi:hypothetical protein
MSRGPSARYIEWALQEHAGEQVVAGGGIGEVVVQQVAMAIADPQMVVRVDDRQGGIEDRFGRATRQPGLFGREDTAELVWLLPLGHRCPPAVGVPAMVRAFWPGTETSPGIARRTATKKISAVTRRVGGWRGTASPLRFSR